MKKDEVRNDITCITSMVIDRNVKIEKSMVPNGTNYSYDGISRYLWYQGIQKWVAGVWFSFAGVCWCITTIVIDRNGKIEKSMVPNGTN